MDPAPAQRPSPAARGALPGSTARAALPRDGEAPRRVFVLSPASAAGKRMALLLSPRAAFPLARAVQGPEGATLGEVFRFASALYFRGKLAYAVAFGRPPLGCAAALVIAPGAGLLPASARVRADDLRAFASVPVDGRDRRFREPLERDARVLAQELGTDGEAVLLGSIATRKYVDPLAAALAHRLRFPPAFVGRGDLSRGGFLLRAVRAGVELEYAPVAGAVVHGPKPPRLGKG